MMDVDMDNSWMSTKKRKLSSGSTGKKYPWPATMLGRVYPPSKFYYAAFPRNEHSRAKYGTSWGKAGFRQRGQRNIDRIQGYGRYGKSWKPTNIARSFRNVGKILGTNVLTKAARERAVEAIKGSGMYQGAASLRGRGRYSTTAPFSNDSAVVKAGQHFKEPHFSGAKLSHDAGGLIITNQEFVRDIYGNSFTGSTPDEPNNFKTYSLPVNPGLASVFPMLSQFAINFDRYELTQCVFHIETQLDAGIIQSSTGQVGDFYMFAHTDPEAVLLQNAGEFARNQASISRVTHGLTCGIECDPAQLRGLESAGYNYVRNVPKSSDLGRFDHGKIQIGVGNTPSDLSNQVIGKLYVTYSVKLVKPEIRSLISRNQLADIRVLPVAYFRRNTDTADNAVVAPCFDIPGGDTGEKVIGDNIGIKYEYTEGFIDKTQSQPKLKMTFPAWLNGLIKITFTMANPHSTFINTSGGSVSNQGYTMIYSAEQSGNVKMMDGVPVNNLGYINSHVPSTIEGMDIPVGMLVAYVRVSSAYGGIENSLTLNFTKKDMNMPGISPGWHKDVGNVDPSIVAAAMQAALWTVEVVNDFEIVNPLKFLTN
jgi:hypothetical protein